MSTDKPCPFCGSEFDPQEVDFDGDYHRPHWWHECACGLYLEKPGGLENLREAWNRRISPPMPDPDEGESRQVAEPGPLVIEVKVKNGEICWEAKP